MRPSIYLKQKAYGGLFTLYFAHKGLWDLSTNGNFKHRSMRPKSKYIFLLKIKIPVTLLPLP